MVKDVSYNVCDNVHGMDNSRARFCKEDIGWVWVGVCIYMYADEKARTFSKNRVA